MPRYSGILPILPIHLSLKMIVQKLNDLGTSEMVTSATGSLQSGFDFSHCLTFLRDAMSSIRPTAPAKPVDLKKAVKISGREIDASSPNYTLIGC
jgi:hypothetical protein